MAQTARTQFSDVDEYGFQRPEDFDYLIYEKFMSKYLTILTNRRMKWDNFMKSSPNLENTKDGKLKRYIRKGIPGHLRGEVWMHISGARALQRNSPKLYKDLLKIKHDREIIEAIKIDLPRTFPENILFETIKFKLFNVLITYAHHNKDVGYCQGLNYIAGLILLVTKNEEWTFWLLKVIVENIVTFYHTKTMSGLITDIDVLEKLLFQRVPEINERLSNFGLPCAVITTKWLICLFAEVLPIETVFRIWDCLFSEGYKIIFRVSLTLFINNKNEILQLKDIGEMADFFRNINKNEKVLNCHEFIENIFKVPGSLRRTDIEKIRLKVTKK